MRQLHSDDTFLEAWNRLQSPTRVAGELGMQVRNVHERRRAMEARYGVELAVVRNIPDRYRDRIVNDAWLHQVPEHTPAHKAVFKRAPVYATRTHCVIPDVQAKPGVPLEHLEWAGKYIADKKPDVIVCIGDFADMPSLSSYDKGKRSAENKRYKADIEAVHYAMELLMTPIVNEPGYKPRLVMTLGNHEARITRFGDDNPAMYGVATIGDLGYEAWGWEVYPFLEVVEIDGIEYSHYFTTGVMGRAASSAAAMLRERQKSCTMGHVQTYDVAMHKKTQNRAIMAATFYQHDEDYLGPQGNDCRRHILFKHEVRNGKFDLMEVSLEYLRKKYA